MGLRSGCKVLICSRFFAGLGCKVYGLGLGVQSLGLRLCGSMALHESWRLLRAFQRKVCGAWGSSGFRAQGAFVVGFRVQLGFRGGIRIPITFVWVQARGRKL